MPKTAERPSPPSAGTTNYVINPNAGLDQILVKTAPNGTVTRYVYGLGLIGEETGSTFTTYHYDYRGSTTALTRINGSVIQRFSYGPNGEPVGFNPATAPTQFLYGGRYGVSTDTNGLCYMRARYYLPAISRFLNQDIVLGNIEVGHLSEPLRLRQRRPDRQKRSLRTGRPVAGFWLKEPLPRGLLPDAIQPAYAVGGNSLYNDPHLASEDATTCTGSRVGNLHA